MIRIRLAKGGKRNDPFYRIVAIEKHRKNQGKPLEILGTYHPKKSDLKIDKKKLNEWVEKGAQVSTGVKKLLS